MRQVRTCTRKRSTVSISATQDPGGGISDIPRFDILLEDLLELLGLLDSLTLAYTKVSAQAGAGLVLYSSSANSEPP